MEADGPLSRDTCWRRGTWPSPLQWFYQSPLVPPAGRWCPCDTACERSVSGWGWSEWICTGSQTRGSPEQSLATAAGPAALWKTTDDKDDILVKTSDILIQQFSTRWVSGPTFTSLWHEAATKMYSKKNVKKIRKCEHILSIFYSFYLRVCLKYLEGFISYCWCKFSVPQPKKENYFNQ